MLTSDLKERIKKVDVVFEAAEAIHDTAKTVVEKQRLQLLAGQRADGSPVGFYANEQYADLKYAMNPKAGYGIMDWKLTGSLHKDIFVDVRAQEGEYIIDSTDAKTGELIKRIGDPFGLTEQNQEDYINETLEETFLNRMHEATGL